MRATFFVTGWIGDHYPELVRMVAERGHEIASQGYYHKSVRQMDPAEFQDPLPDADRDALLTAVAVYEAKRRGETAATPERPLECGTNWRRSARRSMTGNR